MGTRCSARLKFDMLLCHPSFIPTLQLNPRLASTLSPSGILSFIPSGTWELHIRTLLFFHPLYSSFSFFSSFLLIFNILLHSSDYSCLAHAPDPSASPLSLISFGIFLLIAYSPIRLYILFIRSPHSPATFVLDQFHKV